ncbi:hypothetical protein Ahy_B06g079779 [Arachis hypogaea]|uniref:Protein kinase domain-containing protein n=1 Tax=Arachis hypogaea TaxID=3818 RepID=A0A444YG24_ARAHY|nr:hypothetical protein Ahy_B06g079779 [Arachis hypogaea]
MREQRRSENKEEEGALPPPSCTTTDVMTPSHHTRREGDVVAAAAVEQNRFQRGRARVASQKFRGEEEELSHPAAVQSPSSWVHRRASLRVTIELRREREKKCDSGSSVEAGHRPCCRPSRRQGKPLPPLPQVESAIELCTVGGAIPCRSCFTPLSVQFHRNPAPLKVAMAARVIRDVAVAISVALGCRCYCEFRAKEECTQIGGFDFIAQREGHKSDPEFSEIGPKVFYQYTNRTQDFQYPQSDGPISLRQPSYTSKSPYTLIIQLYDMLIKNANGTVIAVKKLNSESLQGLEEWKSEVNFLGRLSHPNLVKLLGYCLEEAELLLIYEFMQKGSLENHLFGRGSAVQPLPWDIRLKIAIGAARGLAFLHTSEKVIYRDFKASNILLDGAYNAKISDFGLAKLGPSASRSHVTTRVMGTYGYAAPEYVATGHLYVKSDVYAFGVVLVEMLTGLRALDPNRPSGQHNLTDWIKPYLHDRRKLKSIMDFRLEGKYPSKAAFRIAQLALRCLETEPKQRPSMKEVKLLSTDVRFQR